MFFKAPKDDEKIQWTKHVKEKMKFYGLTESRLRRLFLNPKRKEKGIAPGTIAIMQPAGTKKRPTEIWLMYQPLGDARGKNLGRKIRIITAWRYPGKSPVREAPPIPEDILFELSKRNKNQRAEK